MKFSRKSIVICLIAAAVAIPSYLALYYRARAAASYAALSNEIVRRDAGLPINGSLDPKQAALAVRDYIYRSYQLGDQKLPDNAAALYASLTTRDGTMSCGGIGLSYVWALQAIGIPARFIQLAGDDFLGGMDDYDTHVTVEVFLDGAWQLSDPTYNVSVSCSTDPTKPIATPEARACVKGGHSLVLTPGKTQIVVTKGGLRIADPKSYGKFFSAYTRRSMSSPEISEQTDTFPLDWYKTGLAQESDCGVQLGLNMQCQ
jgi:Transglutaminase-like superfamily